MLAEKGHGHSLSLAMQAETMILQVSNHLLNEGSASNR